MFFLSFGNAQGNVMTRTGKIAQICLQADARMLQRGGVLLDAIVAQGEKVYTYNWSCGCADDLESNIFWQAMGWTKVGQRRGISHKNTWKQTSKRKVTITYPDGEQVVQRLDSESNVYFTQIGPLTVDVK